MRIAIDGPSNSVFHQVGGRQYFDRLVERFYDGVATDPVLRPLYPDDLTASIEHTSGFLAQFFGGGTVHYSDERGHPRLRARHGHLAIGQAERDAWLGHMTEAVEASDAPAPAKAKMLEYFEMASTHMINTLG